MSCTFITIISFSLAILTLGLLFLVLIAAACGIALGLQHLWRKVRRFFPEGKGRVSYWFEEHGTLVFCLILVAPMVMGMTLSIREKLFGCETCEDAPCVSAQEKADRAEFERIKAKYDW